jgi:hypothetical protein
MQFYIKLSADIIDFVLKISKTIGWGRVLLFLIVLDDCDTF